MRPRRTHLSDHVHRLVGGTEDNDLWAHSQIDTSGAPVICSVWVPGDDERARIAAGENIELIVWGTVMPPVSLRTTDVPLGRVPSPPPTQED